MKSLLRTILPAVLLLALASSSALAQSHDRFATVDLDKLFRNYWKTKQAQALINEHQAELEKEYRSMGDNLKKAGDEYQKLNESANDQAVSSEERDRRKQAAADKWKQIQDANNAAEQFQHQAQSTLADQYQRMQKNIFTEIRAAVAAKAKASGHYLVVNTSVETIVAYSSGENDLTDEVLRQLNAGAPIDTTKPAATVPPPVGASTNLFGNQPRPPH